MQTEAPQDTGAALHPYDLQKKLSALSGCRVMLQLTDNVSTMLSMTRGENELRIVRAHRMFLKSDEPTQNNIANWVAGKGLDHDALNSFIAANEPATPIRRPARTADIRTDGRHYDLKEIHGELNAEYFENRAQAQIQWGRKGRRGARSVRLGCFDPVENKILISPRLDSADVPRYMIEYVVFHEMLHEAIGIGRRADGKRDIHGSDFRTLEKKFPHYERAKAFERKKWGDG